MGVRVEVVVCVLVSAVSSPESHGPCYPGSLLGAYGDADFVGVYAPVCLPHLRVGGGRRWASVGRVCGRRGIAPHSHPKGGGAGQFLVVCDEACGFDEVVHAHGSHDEVLVRGLGDEILGACQELLVRV